MSNGTGFTVTQRGGLLTGIVLFAIILLAPPPAGLSDAGWRTTACALLMAAWWITEAIPISATALLPLVLFPLLGILPISAAARPYANPVIFLFLGGFLIAAALERCGLHRRIAMTILRIVGTSPIRLVGGFMLATAFLSMWVSNTATVVMMLPTAMSVVRVADEEMKDHAQSAPFGKALLLGLAYAANIGGTGTLIGTPPNALLAGFMMETYGIAIGFVEWMMVGLPLVIVALPIVWLVLVKFLFPLSGVSFPAGREIVDREMEKLGPVTRGEWIVGSVTALVAFLWMTRPVVQRFVPGLSDAGIAIGGALVLFLVPIATRPWKPALDWERAERVPWGVLI
ncbi:MAG: SLC13 family permease, partial [Thermoanaerobaculia bacterium]|nr:SLC13 family permease [Thermoanaerobaculia bacterium]